GRLQLRSGAQKSLGIKLAGTREHPAKIEIGFKHVRLGSNRLAIRGDRVLAYTSRIVEKSEIKPCCVILGIAIHYRLQQRLGGGVIFFLNRSFSLCKFWRGRGIFNRDFVMAYNFASL